MRARQGFGDVRIRSPPPTAKTRDREYSPPRRDIQERHSRFASGSNHSEREREQGSGLVERRDYDRSFDGDREDQLRKLSQFNEGLSRGESPSMKFQWKQLLVEPANLNRNVNQCLKHVTSYGGSRMSTEKEYRGSRFMSFDQHETVVGTKPMSLEIERARKFSPPQNSGHVDGRFPSPLKNSNVGLHNDEELQIRDTLRRDRVSARELYKEEENPVFYSKDASHYMMPLSQTETLATMSSGITKNNFPGSYNDSSYNALDGIGRTCEGIADPIGYNGYSPTMRFEASTKPELQVRDVTNYRRAQLSPTKGNPGDHTYSELRISERGDLGTVSDAVVGKMAIDREDYGHRDTMRTSIVDSIVDRIDVTESSHGDHLREDGILKRLRFLLEQPISNYHYVRGALYPSKQEGEVLGSLSTIPDFETKVHPEHEGLRGTEVCQDHGILHEAEDYDFERNAGPWSYEEKLNRLPVLERDPGLNRIDKSPYGRLTTDELGSCDSSENMLKRKHSMDKKMSRQKLGSRLSSDWNTSHNIHDLNDGNEQLIGENMDSVPLPNKFGHSKYRKAVRAFNETGSNRISNSDDLSSSCNLSVSMQRRLGKTNTSAGRDIRKRLRHGPQNGLNPWLRIQKPCKSVKRRADNFHGNLHAPGSDCSDAKVIPAKTDPPEGSEEFKQLVCSTFFKLVKQLNESPAQRRRYKEQGKAGSLKCIVCGSDSKEFVDPQSLVKHAFMSLKIGLRAQHLSFYEALCVLNGWNSAVDPNGSWVRMALPDAEALVLREDLIIWPPIVIIHNNSIVNNDPNERMIVTIEMLETILRDMGFGGGKTKVCRGKPANQSILVVKFNGTYSGLQEAEKLHKFYAENKHGRAQFQQISSDSGNSSSRESRKLLVDKAEYVLYGYLGIAGDLDKLDFEMKKRSVVKSKKGIQAIADAPLKTE